MRPIECYLGYQISMTGDGIAIPGYPDPLLHVFCWGASVNFENELYIGFPLEEEKDCPFQIVGDRLILWGQPTDAWNVREWVYSLRLMALNSPTDLRTYVVDPARALLRGEDICTVLKEEWLDKTLIRYPAKSLLV